MLFLVLVYIFDFNLFKFFGRHFGEGSIGLQRTQSNAVQATNWAYSEENKVEPLGKGLGNLENGDTKGGMTIQLVKCLGNCKG